ncbi:MAG: hypothetical protein ABI841_00875 [Chloroflexota bacterium]
MTVELRDVIWLLALAAEALSEAAHGAIDLLYSAGASNGLDPGGLAGGGAAGGAAGAGAAYGSGSGTTGSGTEDGTTGGSNVGRDDPTRPRVPTSVQARRDRAANPTFGDRVSQKFVDVVTTTGDWAESLVQDDAIFGYKKGQRGYGEQHVDGAAPQI